MCLQKYAIYLIVFFLLSGCSATKSTQKTSEVFSTQSYITNKTFKSVIPITIWNNKIFLNAKVNGKQYRFLLDTGSPTLLTKKVAKDLGLKSGVESTAKDGNGNPVTMEFSVLAQLKIGDVEFRNIPVFIFDPSHMELGDSIFDGGIIGSEIMPLCNWQINFEKKHLILSNDIKQLEFIDSAQAAKLKLYSYPYTPIVEYSIDNSFKDQAIFDTGNSELFTLFDRAFEELKKRKLIDSAIGKAIGTLGVSAGGIGKDTSFHLVALKQLSFGELHFQNIEVWTHSIVASLIGAKIFDSQVVTLDYANKVVYFHEYKDPITKPKTFGFKPYLKDQSVYVGFLKESSPAEKAGMQLHDQILKIDGFDCRELKSLEPIELLEVMKSLSSIQQRQEIEITFKRNGLKKKVLLKKVKSIK